MLNYNVLYKGFLNIFDSNKYTEDIYEVAKRWTKVFEEFYLNMLFPIPGISNPNLYPSLRIFELRFLSAIQNQNVKNQFENLVKDLHLGVCEGVTMTGGYLTTLPVVPLKLSQYFNPNNSVKILSNLLSINIYNWVSTTFSTQISSGVIIKWM